ncbi:MAG TPA: LysM peptidoglycan-binding domain-containing protein [Candidatus Acidoferrum sp.]|jgi:nucleoid-associated protein YgaU|nr:LysM peptidoglycan-binding domain-containing protein [Candidatus Acidoferrum sp.]
MSLTFEHPFATVAEQMYATGYGIRPLRSARRMRPIGRLSAVMLLALSVSLGLAIVAHGGTASQDATVVVQPGDTLWSIAAQRYPSDDVRARVDDIEQANGLHSPVIEAGELLKLPT